MFSPCSLLVRFDAQFLAPLGGLFMKENESVISARGHDRQEPKIEDKLANPLYGAIAWAGISAGTIAMVLTLPRHESQSVYQD